MRNANVKTLRIGIVSATALRLAPRKTRLAHRLVQSAATCQERIAVRKAQSWNTVIGTRVGRDNESCCNPPPNRSGPAFSPGSCRDAYSHGYSHPANG